MVLLVWAAAPALGETVDLNAFLGAAEQAAQVPVPLRGDGQFEAVSPDATLRDEVAILVRPPADAFIELHREAIKAVLLDSGAFRVRSGTGKAEVFALDASLDDSDFTREDLEPFRVSHYVDARIADDSATELTVTLFPKQSQYSLKVITFDRQKKVPLKTLYYRDTVSNLVKMQRDGDYVLVGQNWMPATISMETFKLRTHTTLRLRWSPDTRFPPDIFDPTLLPRPSASLWPVLTPGP